MPLTEWLMMGENRHDRRNIRARWVAIALTGDIDLAVMAFSEELETYQKRLPLSLVRAAPATAVEPCE